MWRLTSENLTHLGGPMGTEYTFDNYVEYFSTKEEAMKYAEKEYEFESKGKTFKWVSKGKDSFRSPDLLWVMYHVKKIEPKA